MRSILRLVVLLLPLLLPLLLSLLLSRALPAQSSTQARREPRFLWMPDAGATPVEIDARRTALLRERVSLSVEGATLGRLLREIEAQTGTRFAYSRAVVPLDRPVDLRAERITVAAALTEILLDTDIDVVFTGAGRVTLARRDPATVPPVAPVGMVRGRVTMSRSADVAIPNARVSVEGTRRSTTTDADGAFRLDSLAAGTHVLRVTALGYQPEQVRVDVPADGAVTVTVSLTAAVVSLDEVVVTGTPFETSRRSVPSPVSVLTAADIQQKQATKLEDLLRGEIAGVMALSSGQADYTTSIYVRGNAAWATSDLMKIYIDGVEVASPFLISTIDPNSIERIEVVRGPQASTIYGSEASSGVLQIFTKKGQRGEVARPRLELESSVGMIASEYRPADASRAVTQEHTVAVDGGARALSYRLGASYLTTGEWVKNYGSRTLGFSGGFRASQGPMTIELSAQWTERALDQAMDPMYQRFPQSPACPHCGSEDRFFDTEYRLGQSTVGLNLSLVPGRRWQHNLIVGVDENRFAYYQPGPNRFTPADTFVSLFSNDYRRQSIRYNTAFSTAIASGVSARLSAGADYWSYDLHGSSGNNLLDALGSVRVTTRTRPSYRNDRWWNSGVFGMAEIGLRDRLFVTLATRVEDNANFGRDFGRAVSPRAGLSYVADVGRMQVKARAAWGTGTRAPNATHRLGSASATFVTLPNPGIGPEEKRGWDGGLELYWGKRGSIAVTRYDERGENLIQAVDVDVTSVPRVRRFENIGGVRSRGWEFEGTLHGGPVTLRGSYAIATSRITSLSNQFTSDPNAFYRVGDRMLWIPKHSGGATLSWRLGQATTSMNMSYMGDWIDYDYERYLGAQFGTEEYTGNDRDYLKTYPSLVRWNLRMERPLRRGLTGFMRLDNLTDNQRSDLSNLQVAPGRTAVVGVRYAY